MNYDAYLDRLWNEHTDAQDAYEREQEIEWIKERLMHLDSDLYDAIEEGRTEDAARIQKEIDELEEELQ